MNPLSWPAIVALEVTPQCNNHCPGCSNVYAGRRSPQVTPAAQWQTWLSQFAHEAVQVRITGGEPTLHPEFFHIFDAVLAYDLWVTLFTNGRWRDPESLLRHVRGRERFTGMLISLHGATRESHEAFTHTKASFNETVRNIRRAVDSGIAVTLSVVMTRQSLAQLDEMIALREQLGASYISFNRYIGPPLPEIEPSSDEMRAAMRKIESCVATGEPLHYGIGVPQCFAANSSEGCLAGVAYVAVDPWGRLRPCAHSPSVVGSLADSSFNAIWNGQGMRTWRSLMPDECTTCAVYASCHGGCRAAVEVRPDMRDVLRRDPLLAPPKIPTMKTIAPEWRLRAACRLRPEAFGYAALGNGAVLPVRPEAREIIMACDGHRTAQELADQFGSRSIRLVGELLHRGLLEVV